jgi:hypothetical protein
MSPIELPPQNPTDALRADRERPRILAVVAEHAPVRPIDPVEHQGDHHERPHGGEPRVQRIRVDLTSSAASGAPAFLDIHQPWLNSESDNMQAMLHGQRIRMISASANPKSTEGQTHRQHKDKNVQVPKQTKRT